LTAVRGVGTNVGLATIFSRARTVERKRGIAVLPLTSSIRDASANVTVALVAREGAHMLPEAIDSERAAIRIISGKLTTTAVARVGSAMKWIFEYVNLATIRSNSIAIGKVVISCLEIPLLLALSNGTKAGGATIRLNVRPAVSATCALSCGRVGGVAALEE